MLGGAGGASVANSNGLHSRQTAVNARIADFHMENRIHYPRSCCGGANGGGAAFCGQRICMIFWPPMRVATPALARARRNKNMNIKGDWHG
jgi:hypothetical protein